MQTYTHTQTDTHTYSDGAAVMSQHLEAWERIFRILWSELRDFKISQSAKSIEVGYSLWINNWAHWGMGLRSFHRQTVSLG